MSENRPVLFVHALYADVSIVKLGLKGRIMSRCEFAISVHKYDVVFWADGKRQTEWMFEHEIE